MLKAFKRVWMRAETGFFLSLAIAPVAAVVIGLLNSRFQFVNSEGFIVFCVFVITMLLGLYRYQHRRYAQQEMLLRGIQHKVMLKVLDGMADSYYAAEHHESEAKEVLKKTQSHDPDIEKYKNDYGEAKVKKRETYENFEFVRDILYQLNVTTMRIEGYKKMIKE